MDSTVQILSGFSSQGFLQGETPDLDKVARGSTIVEPYQVYACWVGKKKHIYIYLPLVLVVAIRMISCPSFSSCHIYIYM